MKLFAFACCACAGYCDTKSDEHNFPLPKAVYQLQTPDCLSPSIAAMARPAARTDPFAAAGQLEAHAGAVLRPGAISGGVTSAHRVAVSAGGTDGPGTTGMCLALDGVQARLLTAAPRSPALAAARPQPVSASADAPAAAPRAPVLVSAGPDPGWTPAFESDDEGAAAPGQELVQLPAAAAPLPPGFEGAVAALPLRCRHLCKTK